MKNYTTKPIELPLSTEKEYVLVDAEGFKESATSAGDTIKNYDLVNPFKFESIEHNDGMIGDWYVIQDGWGQAKYFHEVIRQPKSEVEWKNGDDAIYKHNGVIFIGKYPSPKRSDLVVVDSVDGLLIINIDSLSKPETEAERKDRERLEAAYEIYSVWCIAMGYPKFSFDQFKRTELDLNGMLAIVDKTNYRKEKN